MNPEEIRRQLAALGTELDELRQLDTLTDEQDSRVDAIVNEVNDLGKKLERAVNAENASKSAGDAAAFVSREGQSRGRVSGVQPIDPRAANPDSRDSGQPDRRSIGEQFTESDEYKALLARNASGSAMLEVRTLVGTGTLPTDYLEPKRIAGISRPDDVFGSLRDVLLVGQTDSDSLIWFEENVFTNNATEVAEATSTTWTSGDDAADGTKPESAITFTQKTGVVATIAHWIPITRQTLWNAPEIRSYIEGRLIDGLRLREDDQLLNGNGTAPNLTGLLQTSNIQTLDNTATTGYWATNALDSAGTDRENFDRILRSKTLVATNGRARGNFVVVNPSDYEAFQFTADANDRYYGTGPFTAGNIPTLWGMRVVQNENITAGQALVGDGRHAQIWDRMSATVEAGQIDKQFIRNMFTLLAEERVGLTVYRPKAFALVDLVGFTPA